MSVRDSLERGNLEYFRFLLFPLLPFTATLKEECDHGSLRPGSEVYAS